MSIEDYSRYDEPQHLIIPIKFLDSDEFVPTDLATIEVEKWFKPVAPLTGMWDQPMPYIPHHARTCMCSWRDLTIVFKQLVEVPVPKRFRT